MYTSLQVNQTEVTCGVLLDHFKQLGVSSTLQEVLKNDGLLQSLSDTLKVCATLNSALLYKFHQFHKYLLKF